MSSGMQCCVDGCLVTDVLKDCGALISSRVKLGVKSSETAWFLNMKVPQSFGMLGTTHVVTQCHIPEDTAVRISIF